MSSRTTQPAIRRLTAIGLCALTLSGCSVILPDGPDAATKARQAKQVCTSVGEPGPTTVLLVAGKDPVLERTTQEIASANMAPAAVYDRFAETSAPDGGILVVVRPTPTGDIGSVKAFDLRSTGANRTEAGATAIARRDCLLRELRSLPEAPLPALDSGPGASSSQSQETVTEADVITSAPGAVAAARDRAGQESIDLVIVGLSRSNLGGKVLARIDLQNGVRTSSLDQLASAGVVVPKLTGVHLSVRFLAPGEGLPAHLQSGFDALANDLCTSYDVERCHSVEEL
jgi:hypothetical protein